MSRKNRKNQQVLKEMKQIFYGDNDKYLDWMGYEITSDNFPTYHHVCRRTSREDDNTTIDNGAYLGEQSHNALHYIERLDKSLYNAWNEIFTVINQSRKYPTLAMWDEVKILQDRSMELLNSKEKNKVKRKI